MKSCTHNIHLLIRTIILDFIVHIIYIYTYTYIVVVFCSYFLISFACGWPLVPGPSVGGMPDIRL